MKVPAHITLVYSGSTFTAVYIGDSLAAAAVAVDTANTAGTYSGALILNPKDSNDLRKRYAFPLGAAAAARCAGGHV